MLVLTSDGFTFTVPDAVAERCDTLRAASDCEGPVPLAHVSSSLMARVIQYYARMAELEREEAHDEELRTYRVAFFESMPRSELYLLMEAANYLGASSMLHDACEHVAGLIKGRSPAQIRELFMLPPDMTAEEARRAEEEFAWAFK